ncbi:MAG: branched-chain amino acid ABC transporter permease [Oscillospiraceae bacterium]|jgi:branched-chain amino acid transport system permease protein|nr:branched-chain amino acid ABC transporter permease [Oscillospiraceae bacterium]
MTKKQKIISVGLLILFYALIFTLEQVLPAKSMMFTVLKKGAIYALVAVSMNLLNGFTGLFSLGQAGFMLIGAYAYAIFTIPIADRINVYQYFDGGVIQFALPVVLALVIAGIAAALFAALIGLPVLRLKSDYLAIATLGFAEIIRAIFQWDKLGPVTNGSNLLRKFPTFDSFNITDANGDVVVYLSTFVPFIIVGICVFLMVLLINSSYGRAFRAIRDDERAAEAMGINLFAHKELSFVISSFFAGVGGALLAMYQTAVQASSFKSAMTYEILLIVVIGGLGSVTGSCISSFLFIAASEWWLRGLDGGTFLGINAPTIFRAGFRKVVFAVIIMVIVLFYRKGLMGENEFSLKGISNFFKRVFGRKKRTAK